MGKLLAGGRKGAKRGTQFIGAESRCNTTYSVSRRAWMLFRRAESTHFVQYFYFVNFFQSLPIDKTRRMDMFWGHTVFGNNSKDRYFAVNRSTVKTICVINVAPDV